MKRVPLFEFSINRKNRTIQIQREFDADLELVWQAWTSGPLLDRWCAPKPYRTETKSLDFREGGHWHYAIISPEGKKHWSRYDYKKIEPGKSIVELRAFSDEHGRALPDFAPTECTLFFSQGKDHALVTMTEKYSSPEMFEKMAMPSHKKGFSSHLKNLDGLLLTLKIEQNETEFGI